jgi:hypothetical protein
MAIGNPMDSNLHQFTIITIIIYSQSCEQWMKIFDDYIFPLLKSMHAVRTDKEEVFAPELKRGVKMQVHHSRDTVQKQV